MGKFYTGLQGALRVDRVPVGRVRDWRFSGQVETLETTNLGDFARDYVPGRQSYAASCTAFWYADDAGVLQGKSMFAAVLQTGQVDPNKRYVIEMTSSNILYKFNAIVSSIETGAQVGDVMQASVTFQICGPLTEVNLGGL